MPIDFQCPATKTPTSRAATPYIRFMTTATIPTSKAILPHTTNVLAENIVINALKPETHHGDFPPALNMSDEFLTSLPKNKPKNSVPAK